jgi:hypothetical protein
MVVSRDMIQKLGTMYMAVVHMEENSRHMTQKRVPMFMAIVRVVKNTVIPRYIVLPVVQQPS